MTGPPFSNSSALVTKTPSLSSQAVGNSHFYFMENETHPIFKSILSISPRKVIVNILSNKCDLNEFYSLIDLYDFASSSKRGSDFSIIFVRTQYAARK